MSSVWDWLIPVLTLIAGLIVGFAAGVYYLRRQMEKMQNDPEMLTKMAKQMGYNMNRQQLAKAQQMMKQQQGKNAGMKPPVKSGKR